MNGIDVVRSAILSCRKNLGYTRLQYITFTGNQYINSGIVPDDNTQITVNFKTLVKETSFITGCRTGYNRNSFSIADNFDGSEGILLQYNNYSFNSKTMSPVFGIYNIVYLAREDSTLNDININYTFSSLNTNLSIYIGALNQNNQVEGRNFQGNIYDYKVFREEILLRHFIPVRLDDGTVGLQDLIENRFYANEGSSPLIAGPEYSQEIYIPLEYISSTGAGEYIDTGVKGVSNLSFELECAFNSITPTTQYACGLLIPNEVRNTVVFKDVKNVFAYTKTLLYEELPYTGTFDTDFHTYIFNEIGTGNILMDGNIIDVYDPIIPEVTVDSTIYLFARNYSNILSYANIRIKRFKIWNSSGELLRSYQAMYQADIDTVGMYDSVTDEMYINIGAGAFIPGAQI